MKKAARLNVPLKSFSEFVPDVLPDIDWVVEGLFERDSLVSMFGPSNEGKSFVAMSIAYAVAMGVPWLDNADFRTDKWKGPVIYLAAEGQRGAKRRAKALLLHFKPDTTPQIFFKETAVQIWKDTDLKEFLVEVKKAQPVLIIIDTLARTSVGMDENSNSEMNVYVDAADILRRETGACILLVHHTKKNPKHGETPQERGAYSLRAAMDTAISVSMKGGVITIRCQKQKDDKAFADIHVSLQQVEVKPAYGDTKAQVSAVVVPVEDSLPDDIDPRRNAALDVLTHADEPLSFTEWRDKTVVNEKQIPKATFSRLVKGWLTEGVIEETEQGTYRLNLTQAKAA